ncbi:MAG: membrane protein insertion efficiency factor YidD [Chthoniobacterales bacterium]|nr:membrane protein insertion efficiency factor YidD [Chthoniobacterales bacterium]
MPALRQPVKRRRRFWIIWAIVAVFAVAAVVDWRRPPWQQASVRAYERTVLVTYRRVVKPITSSFVLCRFRPTCSHYSLQAVRWHGFPVGIWMTTKRLFRCLPWVAPGTLDPVPPPRPRRAPL